jgi:hypothetical protein
MLKLLCVKASNHAATGLLVHPTSVVAAKKMGRLGSRVISAKDCGMRFVGGLLKNVQVSNDDFYIDLYTSGIRGHVEVKLNIPGGGDDGTFGTNWRHNQIWGSPHSSINDVGIERWSFPVITDGDGNFAMLRQRIWRSESHAFDGHPSTLIKAKMFDCSVHHLVSLSPIEPCFHNRLLSSDGRSNHRSVLPIDQSGINGDSPQSQCGDKKHKASGFMKVTGPIMAKLKKFSEEIEAWEKGTRRSHLKS